MLTSPKTKTIPLGILASFSAADVSWGRMTALSVFAIIPAVVISIFLNRYFVQGLTLGASKG
jgi:multiple sugar transport system permease protein